MSLIQIFITFAALFFTYVSFAQSGIELSCRSQAKEVAVQTYQSCVTTARQKRIGEIRKEYQEKLSELKSHYDGELKKVSGASSKDKSGKAAKKNGKSQDAVAGLNEVGQKLPEKRIKGQTLSIESSSGSQKVVVPNSDSGIISEGSSESNATGGEGDSSGSAASNTNDAVETYKTDTY